MPTEPKTFCYRYPHPAVTTDVALFTIREQQLQLLLIQRGGEPFRGSWALPGGFLEIDEDLEACARRELEEETGIKGIHLEQLYTVGRPDRDPRERVISVIYLGLAASEQMHAKAGSDAQSVAWFPFSALPELAFDHAEVITLAHQRLLTRLHDSGIALQLMPPTFFLSELQSVYEILLGRSLGSTAFSKHMLHQGLIEATGDAIPHDNQPPEATYRMKKTVADGYNQI